MTTEIPKPPLRMLVMLVLMAALIVYETNPDLQTWVRYQAVRARAWLQYGREWLAWKQRQAQRGH